jgi:nucleoside-diphosphate-sugar epimerase
VNTEQEADLRTFVAGATGLIGRRLVPLLVESGDEVVGMSRSQERADRLGDDGARGVVADVYDSGPLRGLLAGERPEIVVHELGDIPRRLEPGHTIDQFAANRRMRTEGTRSLVEAARAAGARRLVAQSYAQVYAPHPALAERVLRNEQPAFRSTRQRGAYNAKASAQLDFAPAWTTWRDGLRSELAKAAVA